MINHITNNVQFMTRLNYHTKNILNILMCIILLALVFTTI